MDDTMTPQTGAPLSDPPEPPPPPKRSWVLPAALAGVLVAAAAGAGAFFLLKGPGKAATPEEALTGFYAAVAEGDCEGAAVLTDPSFVTQQDLCSNLGQVRKDIGALGRIHSTDNQGSVAYIVASRTVAGVEDQRIVTVKNDPQAGWRVAGGSACYGEETPADLGNEHLDAGATFSDYSSNPPTSGPHDSTPTETGVMFDSPQPVEQVVHAMEHGAVVFWVDPALGPKLVEQAKASVNEIYKQGYESLVYTPQAGMTTPFAMTAWGSLQKCVGFDQTEMQTFVDAHYGQGGEGYMACFAESAASLAGCAGKGL